MGIFDGTPRPDRPSATEIKAMMESGIDKAYSQGYKEGLRKAVEVVKVCKANWIYTGNPDEIDECVWQLETLIKES